MAEIIKKTETIEGLTVGDIGSQWVFHHPDAQWGDMNSLCTLEAFRTDSYVIVRFEGEHLMRHVPWAEFFHSHQSAIPHREFFMPHFAGTGAKVGTKVEVGE